MKTTHKLVIAIAASAVLCLTTTSLFLSGRHIDLTLQKSVGFTSAAGGQVEAGLKVQLEHDASGYALNKQAWATKSVAGRKLEGSVKLAVDSRREH